MKINRKPKIILLLLAIVFAVGLTFASVEFPRLVNAFLHNTFEFPIGDPHLYPEQKDAFLQTYGLQILGYGSLVILAGLIIAGLLAEKRGLAAVGGLGFFLPVFGHFCRSMFFLAGLGLLRTLWLPITDQSFDLLRLGDVIYVPYMILVYFPALLNLDIRPWLGYVVMGLGMLIFVAGVEAWFIARYRKQELVDLWIYRFSRHPQYLGWIIWSYGLLLHFIGFNEDTRFKLSWYYPDSLPWLIATLVIIGVAFLEEIQMRRRVGESYDSYHRQTPFLLPLPRFISTVMTAPLRLILKKSQPENGREVAWTMLIYAALFILLSLPFFVFNWPGSRGWGVFPYNVFPFR